MVKVLLIFIAIILVTVSIYCYSRQGTEKPISTLPYANFKAKEGVKKMVKILPQSKEFKTEESSNKNSIVRDSKIAAQKQIHSRKEKSGIDAAIVKSLNNPTDYPSLPSEDEMVKMMTEDLKSENK